jgi:uncharacterized protein YegL
MTDEAIAAVNEGIGELFREINGDPIVDSKARVSVITFSDHVEIMLPLTQSSEIEIVPGCLRSDNPSSYTSIFRHLKSQIEMDIALLRSQGFVVQRPWIFFMTIGKPVVEDWRYFLKQLTDAKFIFRPNIVTFGLPGADPSVIKEVSTPWGIGSRKESFAFLSEHGVNPGAALREIMKFTVHS